MSPPPRLGGVLYVFEEADLPSIQKVLAALDLQKTEIFACKANVVVFVPGVAEDAADRIEQAISLQTKSRTIERAVIPPSSASR